MIKFSTKKSMFTRLALALATGVAVTAAGSSASAADKNNCTVQLIQYNIAAGGTLIVQCSDGVNYYAQVGIQGNGSGTGCGGTSMDSLKAMESLANAALLSGKTVHMAYSVCSNGINGFWAIDVHQ